MPTIDTPVAAQTLDVLRVAGATIGTLITLPVVFFLWRVAGDWRERGNILRTTGDAVQTLTDPEKGVVARIAKQEYILTGDGGTNGVRGDVKRLQVTVEEVQSAQREQNDRLHTALGKREVAEEEITKRLSALERRGNAKRRRSA